MIGHPPDPSHSLANLSPRRGWALGVYVDAREASGTFRGSRPPRGGGRVGVPGEAVDPQRAAFEAGLRAKRMVRRYCAANRLNRLGTLTYAGAGCHDPLALRGDVAAFWRELRRLVGDGPFPYLWVPEWHPGGHGLHVHFGVGRFIKRSLIEQAWAHGFVHIKLLRDLPVGSGRVAESRRAASYLAKYASKDFNARRMGGLHRYEVAEGFQPKVTPVWAPSRQDAIRAASALMRAQPERFWTSDSESEWFGPPAV